MIIALSCIHIATDLSIPSRAVAMFSRGSRTNLRRPGFKSGKQRFQRVVAPAWMQHESLDLIALVNASLQRDIDSSLTCYVMQ